MFTEYYSSVFEGNGDLRGNKPESHLFQTMIAPWLDGLPMGNKRVLDIAAGQGVEAAMIANFGWQTVAMEPSSLLSTHSFHNNRVRGVAEALPFKGDTFSGIICKDALIFLSPEVRREMLCEAHRVLVDGGKLLLVSQRSDALRIHYVPHDGTFAQKETYETDDAWQQHLVTISRQGSVFAIEYTTLPDQVVALAESCGFVCNAITNYGGDSPLSLENRWMQIRGFVLNLRKK